MLAIMKAPEEIYKMSGHSGIKGNELADMFAKEEETMQKITDWSLFSKTIEEKRKKEINHSYNTTQIYSGHFNSYLYKIVKNDQCECGLVAETVKHVIFERFKYYNQRSLYFVAKLKRLELPFNQEKFMKAN
ncbi:hypothetical protein LAZ67_10000910 [Cordylochernes scorpioides]|uniref:RNase H type-1 domain-containing protein n=1 Tax=Cordylochernes scorpioides TaxID=51811 RepID=A0ABY6KY62_9ARAC|nr:hypothetical protein LAZ67_10000910 [Cordylochernes scorpioides]